MKDISVSVVIYSAHKQASPPKTFPFSSASEILQCWLEASDTEYRYLSFGINV